MLTSLQVFFFYLITGHLENLLETGLCGTHGYKYFLPIVALWLSLLHWGGRGRHQTNQIRTSRGVKLEWGVLLRQDLS